MLKLPTKDEVRAKRQSGKAMSSIEQMIISFQPEGIEQAHAWRASLWHALFEAQDEQRRRQEEEVNEHVWFEISEGADHQWYWRLWAKNGRIIADGGQGYSEEGNAVKAAQRVIRHLRSGFVEIKKGK